MRSRRQPGWRRRGLGAAAGQAQGASGSVRLQACRGRSYSGLASDTHVVAMHLAQSSRLIPSGVLHQYAPAPTPHVGYDRALRPATTMAALATAAPRSRCLRRARPATRSRSSTWSTASWAWACWATLTASRAAARCWRRWSCSSPCWRRARRTSCCCIARTGPGAARTSRCAGGEGGGPAPPHNHEQQGRHIMQVPGCRGRLDARSP